ncbi:MAG: YeeE/YedE family protein, partial [Myxococcales bacterium]|nr:YeeE/YedE family protein [Myxococcales bacterium]
AGISGIVGGLLGPSHRDSAWRLLFVSGLVVGGVIMSLLLPSAFAITVERSLVAVAVAGLLVGVGTRLGNGCTSGHGVCGTSRLSPRSIVATVTFIGSGAATVFVVNHLLGGVL